MAGSRVAPHTGAWIETGGSRPSVIAIDVAPHTGAWIETLPPALRDHLTAGRTPHGCVD